MDWQYADSTRSTERPATIACTTETASVVPLSDIGDWSDNHGTPWNAYGLRRMRSWMTGAVSNNRLPTLPAWLGIETIGSYIAPRRQQQQPTTSLRCDFIGILTLIVGSFIPVGYYAFLHESYGILVGYMAMFVGIGVVGVAASVLGRVEDPKRAGWRPVIFMAIAGSGLAPVIHGSVLHGYKGAVDRISLWYVITMALLYIAGTALYAFKIPERYRPGKHNVFMHSHQIFHVFVVLAAVCHYVGILRALSWAHRI
ncbi:hypothetical protein GGF40_000871 [Coemansia sp. RSA 1286]|nr:hypothetical protein GGF40_000871 [Coemansia sp. RSA 1286]